MNVRLSTRNIAATPALGSVTPEWRVFLLCLACTVVGVAVSLFVFPPIAQMSWMQTVAIGVIIAFVMMLVNYSAKSSNTATRDQFTPVDLLNYTVQGFLWPATWPALAEKLGQVIIEPAKAVASGAVLPV